MTATRSLVFLSRWLPWIGIIAVSSLAFHLYDFAYFWMDDFNNLYWIQRTSGTEMFKAVLDPTSLYARATGMGVYWLLWYCCDVDAAMYHRVAFLIYVLNVGLVYLILRRIVHSTYGAAFGAVYLYSRLENIWLRVLTV